MIFNEDDDENDNNNSSNCNKYSIHPLIFKTWTYLYIYFVKITRLYYSLIFICTLYSNIGS